MDRRRDRDGASDRRPPRGPPRDADRPPRDRDADRGDRERRDNHRRDDRDDRNRRYRSRSRDRRDRPRDDREREGGRSGRGHGRDGDRRREHEERPRRRDDDERAPPRRRDDDERNHRDKDRRRSASPRHGSASPPSPPPRQAEGRHAETLPTRGKLGDRGRKEQQQTMSFKVGGARDSPRPDSGRSSEQPEGDARMDEDRDEREEGEQEEDDLEVEGDDAMAAMMGFGGFGTTKNKKIAGNNVGGVRKEKKSEYRQYMNRQGGFNRPLSPGR